MARLVGYAVNIPRHRHEDTAGSPARPRSGPVGASRIRVA